MGVFVDRVEEGVAVLVEGGRERRVPLGSLPRGTREGAWLTDDLSALDPEAARRTAEEIEARRKRLARDDDGGDFGL